VLTKEKIVINEKVQFAVNKAEILPESYGLLNEVADVMKKNLRSRRFVSKGTQARRVPIRSTPGSRTRAPRRSWTTS